jgi:hypothetical protein
MSKLGSFQSSTPWRENFFWRQSTGPTAKPVAGILGDLGHPQGRALKSKLNFLGRFPCLSLIGIDLQIRLSTLKFRPLLDQWIAADFRHTLVKFLNRVTYTKF